MSAILGANGQPAELATDAPRMSTTEVRETRDVRVVTSGILHLNLSMTIHRLNMHHMMLQQVEEQMKQQKVIIDPPEVQHLRALIENDLMARDVMVREIDHRERHVDAARLAEVAGETPKADLA